MTRDFLSPALVAIFKVRRHMTRRAVSGSATDLPSGGDGKKACTVFTVSLDYSCDAFNRMPGGKAEGGRGLGWGLVHSVMQLQLKATSQISSRENCKRLASASSCGFLIDAMRRMGNAACPKHVQIFHFSWIIHLQLLAMFTCSQKGRGVALVLLKLCVKWLFWRMHTFEGKRRGNGTAGAFCLSLWLLCRTHLFACNAPHLSELHQSALHWPAHMCCILSNGKKRTP